MTTFECCIANCWEPKEPLFIFPTDEAERQKWIDTLKPIGFTPSIGSKVCSSHFKHRELTTRRVTETFDEIKGLMLRVTLQTPTLVEKAVPSKFPLEVPPLTADDSNAVICRMCRCSSQNMKSIFDVENFEDHITRISDVIMSFTTVKILKGDELPSSVCSKCTDELHKVMAIKRRCERNDYKLRFDLEKNERLNDPLIKSEPDDTNVYPKNNEVDSFSNTNKTIIIKQEHMDVQDYDSTMILGENRVHNSVEQEERENKTNLVDDDLMLDNLYDVEEIKINVDRHLQNIPVSLSGYKTRSQRQRLRALHYHKRNALRTKPENFKSHKQSRSSQPRKSQRLKSQPKNNLQNNSQPGNSEQSNSLPHLNNCQWGDAHQDNYQQETLQQGSCEPGNSQPHNCHLGNFQDGDCMPRNSQQDNWQPGNCEPRYSKRGNDNPGKLPDVDCGGNSGKHKLGGQLHTGWFRCYLCPLRFFRFNLFEMHLWDKHYIERMDNERKDDYIRMLTQKYGKKPSKQSQKLVKAKFSPKV